MANEYLISKWKMWFSWFDHNADGKVCAEDLERAREKYANLHHYDADRKKAAMDAYSAWWSEYLMFGKSEITEAEFIECQKKAFEADRTQFAKRIKKGQEAGYSLMDLDGDGMCTEEDCMIMLKSAEHNDDAVNQRWFDAHSVDGKVPVKTSVDMWTHFLTCDDESKPDMIVQLFKSGF
ncbi:sarcoplasmic calcium-binding protein-like [Mercenaria mercenaria]|uniref:sarcoplasmic calcium-binding protein-like n=1 Tax=Mercenaria mercenaria TaxID=6596 RepID=UPI00234F4D9F|nr:sarcoplasmic calcium-binding protein-like [Mercenaria mercenaria]